jgi:hypothetical protein
LRREIPNMARQTMKEVPEARPSNPSRRLMALVIATTQKTVIGIDQIPSLKVPKGKAITSIFEQVRAKISPAMIWNENLTPAGILRKSSTAPSPRTIVEAKNSHQKLIFFKKSMGKKKKSI